MKKIQVIDLVRTLCVLAVFSIHLAASEIAASPVEPLGQAIWRMIQHNGSYGVYMFFLISGFLITKLIDANSKSLFQPDFKNFYARRAGRIFPLLLLVMVIGLGVLGAAKGSSPATDFCFKNPSARFGASLWISIWTFSFNWYRIYYQPHSFGFGLNWDVLWSLSIEEQFYLFFPLALRRLRNERNLFFFLSIFLLMGPASRSLAVFFSAERTLMIYHNSFGAFDLIAMGSLLYLFSKRWGSFLEKNKKISFGLCGLGLVIVGAVYTHTKDNLFDKIGGPSVLGLGLFLFLLGALRLKIFESKIFIPMAWPGRVSYGGYLFHASVLYFLWPFLAGKGVFLSFTVFAAATIGLSVISYRLYEIPANLLVREWLGRWWRKGSEDDRFSLPEKKVSA